MFKCHRNTPVLNVKMHVLEWCQARVLISRFIHEFGLVFLHSKPRGLWDRVK